jgi:hypothetical protein
VSPVKYELSFYIPEEDIVQRPRFIADRSAYSDSILVL